MHWIIRFITYNRTIASLVGVICVCLFLLTRSSDHQQRIARGLTLSVFYPFQFYISQSTRIKNIFAENKTLKEEIASQSATIALLKEKVLETGRLEQLLELQNELSYEDMVTARVVAREPSFFSRSAIISAGKDNGVMPYMPVINSSGVAGKVIQATRHMAMVQLLNDPSNRTGVLIRRTRETGILETENGTDFFIKLRVHADVGAGDTVVTSGLGGVYPKGLNVGEITRVQEGKDPLFKKVSVKVNVEFNHLEEVFVLRVRSQWASFRDEADSLKVLKGAK
jgi:rod shape-determining protein MreC